IANSKLNYSLNLNANFTDNAVIRNNTLIDDPNFIPKPGERAQKITETTFLNMDGTYRMGGNYSISKQLNNRKYNLFFRGSVNYGNSVSLNNGQKNVNKVTTFFESFGPKINPTEWFEINPYVSYTNTNQRNTLFTDNKTNTLALNLDGRVYLWETNLIGYSASKNYIRGISGNINNNPFIVNLYYEKELFERRGKVTLQVFDLLNQNNFIQRDQNLDGGYVDTKSNALSRYFMLRLSMRLQKWTGAQGRNGRGSMRRGDGSFMD
ncbi:MAG TPA: hypothetical protein VKB19_10960, partial [Pedobacter sp.]|nr:hypothetical protein [Pedobacter sp.]